MSVWEADRIERERVVRYADLVPCLNAFIDTRNPGSEAKENFTIIGPGVSENPEQHVHIAEPHGFNIGGARQPPGCVNSQHSHDTAEVFVVHTGRWRFTLGERGEDATVECGPGDVISLPTGMFRGFTNIGEELGYLFAVLGGNDPGRVLWAPYVFDMAEKFGLVLLANGALIDTRAGEKMPEGIGPMPRTSRDQVAALHVPTPEEAEALVWRADRHALAGAEAIIGPEGKFQASHGFRLDRLVLGVSEEGREGAIAGKHVLFVHQGVAELTWDSGTLRLGEGDTMAVPEGLGCRLASTEGCTLYRVSR
jgi:mannose-6-phosphate isomerase-like protein (cupin superfamily)